jgi:hypothetical protein
MISWLAFGDSVVGLLAMLAIIAIPCFHLKYNTQVRHNPQVLLFATQSEFFHSTRSWALLQS